MIFRELGNDIDLLCAALKCSPSELRAATIKPAQFCDEISIARRRRSARPRSVWKVRDPLRRIQRQIALWLKPVSSKQAKCVTAYRKGGSALKNAQVHAGKSVVIVADLKDFFGSISLLDVVALFERLGVARQAAVILARLTTLEEKLVPGARTSPAIANLVASRLDELILGK